MHKLFFTALLMFMVMPAIAQQLYNEGEAVRLALNNNKNIQAVALQVQQQQQLLSASTALSNTGVQIEKGPYDGMVFSIEQNFEWPTVYGLRKKAQLQRIGLVEKQALITQLDIKKLVLDTYLQVQYRQGLLAQYRIQDSLYENLLTAARRNFAAGQINKLEEQFAANQYYLVHLKYTRTQSDYAQWRAQLNLLMGVNADFKLSPLSAANWTGTMDTFSNPTVDLALQQIRLSDAELNIAKAQNYPDLIAGLSFPLQTPYQSIPGFKAGISLPLFSGNRSRIKAAETGVLIARSQLEARQQQFGWRVNNARQTFLKEKNSLDLYQSLLSGNADDIIATAWRLFQAGQLSYVEALRNAALGFEAKINFLEVLFNYNQAILDHQYLTGKL